MSLSKKESRKPEVGKIYTLLSEFHSDPYKFGECVSFTPAGNPRMAVYKSRWTRTTPTGALYQDIDYAISLDVDDSNNHIILEEEIKDYDGRVNDIKVYNNTVCRFNKDQDMWGLVIGHTKYYVYKEHSPGATYQHTSYMR